MDKQETLLRPNHQTVFEKFVSACQADELVMARFWYTERLDTVMFERLERLRNMHR